MITKQAFGRSGHLSSRILLGAAAFSEVTQAETDAALELALSFGVNHVDVALGGAIGGALTLPMRSLSSPATLVRASVRGTFSRGAAFLVFQILAFYTGYILIMLAANPLESIVGLAWAYFPGMALPAGVGGFLAARLASR